MSFFSVGDIIVDEHGLPIKIEAYHCDGWMKEIYFAEYKGEKKILKWYSIEDSKCLDDTYKNMKSLAALETGCASLLIPNGFTAISDNHFGAVTDIIPDGFMLLHKMMDRTDVGYNLTFFSEIDISIKLISAIGTLLEHGYVIYDFGDSNIYVNPSSGELIINCCEDIVPCKEGSGAIAKLPFIAPEAICDENFRFSRGAYRYYLSVLLFNILFHTHPLEGKRFLVPCLTKDILTELYGKNPLFIFDPEDDGNRPVVNFQTFAKDRWNLMPKYMKDAFCRAFGKVALSDPSVRLGEFEWLELFAMLKQDSIVGNTEGRKQEIRLPKYDISVCRGCQILKCQILESSFDDAWKSVFYVVAKHDDPDSLGLKNLTEFTVEAVLPSGAVKNVQPQQVIPLVSGIKIGIFDQTVEIL